MRPTRFSILLLLNALAVAAVVGAFNIAVDPYLVFGTARRAGWNDDKPAATTHERMMKAYDAIRQPARTVIMGSSRTDIGLDPQHAAWPQAMRPVYNLSLVGSGLDSSLRYLRHFVASRPVAAQPTTIIVGLDFESFLNKPAGDAKPVPTAAPSSEAVEVDERMLVLSNGAPNPDRTSRRWKDIGASALSLNAVTDSLATVIANRMPSGASMAPDGHFSEAGFQSTTAADGVNVLFTQKNYEARSRFGTPHQVLSELPNGPIPDMATLKALLDFAHSRGIIVLLTIQPNHASRLDLMTQMGYWPDYERWKRELTALVATEKSAGAAVTLWDFGGYEEFGRETIPPKNDRSTRLKWFWDPVHYTSNLGDVMIARMNGDTRAPDYGVILTPSTIESHLALVREQQRQSGSSSTAAR